MRSMPSASVEKDELSSLSSWGSDSDRVKDQGAFFRMSVNVFHGVSFMLGAGQSKAPELHRSY